MHHLIIISLYFILHYHRFQSAKSISGRSREKGEGGEERGRSREKGEGGGEQGEGAAEIISYHYHHFIISYHIIIYDT
jgi:hypothetical protein